MSHLLKICVLFPFLISTVFAKDCPEKFGKYGNKISYQDISCRFFISADKTNKDSYRSLIFTDEGQIQVFSNFPGTTNSNSTGARVYYLFPSRASKEITEVDSMHLALTDASGAKFNFDKTGRVSSPDLKMNVSSEINSRNKSGVEIASYSKGIVIDLGYRMGNSPVLNKNAVVTVTDKNLKKCTFLNSEFHKISKYDAELIYKTNEELYSFLSKKCKGLDLSDLLSSFKEGLKKVSKVSKTGKAIKEETDQAVLDSSVVVKDQSDSGATEHRHESTQK